MSIIVNPHSPQEELELLAFLDSMKYEYSKGNELSILSEAQQREILDRDKEYESGEAESYSLDDIITYFNVREK